MEVIGKAKKNVDISFETMCTITKNLDKCDHHDLCRLDLLLTMEANKLETEYQWGSIILELKWKL